MSAKEDNQDYIRKNTGPLPMVTPDTLHGLAADKEKGYLIDNDSIVAWLGRLTRENPAISGYLQSFMENCPFGEDSGTYALWGMMGVYELLRRQAESNALKESLGE